MYASNHVMRMRTEHGLLCMFHGEKKEALLGMASNHVIRNGTEYGLMCRFHGEKKEELLGMASNHVICNRTEYGLMCRFHGGEEVGACWAWPPTVSCACVLSMDS